MALKPKTALLQVRIDPDLLEEFRRMCAEDDYTASDMARRLIHHQVVAWQKREKSRLEYAITKAQRADMSPWINEPRPTPTKVPPELPVAAPVPSANIRKANRRPKKGQR